MSRGSSSRGIFAALMALALLANFGLPVAAAPTDETGPDSSVVTQALASVEGTHFGFSRVLNQTSSTTPGTTTNTTNPPSSGLTGGTPCTNVIGGICTITGGGTTGTYNKTGSGTLTLNNIQLPAGVAGSTAPAVGTLPVLFVPTTVNANPGEQIVCSAITAANTTNCVGTLQGDPLANATASLIFTQFNGARGTVTFIVSPANVTAQTQLTQAQAVVVAVVTGVGNGPCAVIVGQRCTVTGGVTGTYNKTGSGTLTVTATIPGGAIGSVGQTIGAGQTPVLVVYTTTSLGLTSCGGLVAGVACNPATAGNQAEFFSVGCAVTAVGATTTACTVNTVGDPLQGSTVYVCYNNAVPPAAAVAVCANGIINGPGVGLNTLPPFPLLPPPPLEFIPPPPPPLLPPPPPGPLAAPAAPVMPSVPVIPEADSLVLLVGGLVALGGLVGYRSLRRRRD
jgi:hypothetical protein